MATAAGILALWLGISIILGCVIGKWLFNHPLHHERDLSDDGQSITDRDYNE